MHKLLVETIILSHFEQSPRFVRRITIGICNEVYLVGLEDKEVIVRLSQHTKYLMGSHDHIPELKRLGIKVPDILFEDYSKNKIPFSYQIQSKIEGQDLGQVIDELSNAQLKALAKEIASIFNKIKTLAIVDNFGDQFGVIWGGGDNDLSDSWTARMKIWIAESVERGRKTGIMDSSMLALAQNIYAEYKSYFDSVKPITYYGDISSKNVMIDNGVFSGLVDLDGLTQGDPLEAIGRIALSWYGTCYGEIYSNAIIDEMGFDAKERKLVSMYALLNKISCTCENGIQFNSNTQAKVDKTKEQNDKELINTLADKLQKFEQ